MEERTNDVANDARDYENRLREREEEEEEMKKKKQGKRKKGGEDKDAWIAAALGLAPGCKAATGWYVSYCVLILGIGLNIPLLLLLICVLLLYYSYYYCHSMLMLYCIYLYNIYSVCTLYILVCTD